MIAQSSTSCLPAQRGMQIKICGTTEPSELHMLDRAGIDYAGLWFHVPLGRYSLDKRRLDDGLEPFKVLHVQRGKCLENPLLQEYAVCGADAFILDNFVSRQRPG